MLRAIPTVEVVATAATGAGLVQRCHLDGPDIVLLELTARGWGDPDVVLRLRRNHPRLRIIGLPGDPGWAESEAFRHEVVVQLDRCDGVAAITNAVCADTTVRPISATAARPPSAPGLPELLSDDDLEIVGHIANDRTSREIAEFIGITTKAVENRGQRMFAKLGVQNKAPAVAMCARAGVLAPHHDVGATT